VIPLALAALTVACSGGGGGGGGNGNGGGGVSLDCTAGKPAVSFKNDVAPIFGSCSGGEICHFSLYQSASNLVNVMPSRDSCTDGRVLVKPNDPSHSYVVQKLRGVDLCPDSQPMPPGSPLPESQIQMVVDWICQGAEP
jgi:hypothetical protein